MNNMMDLMYFGYDFTDTRSESIKNETDFIDQIKEKFPNVELVNAYDEIKGYRQEVWLNNEQEDDYYAFLFGNGWFELSLTLQIALMSNEKNDELKRWIGLAKEKYPESFKTEDENKKS